MKEKEKKKEEKIGHQKDKEFVKKREEAWQGRSGGMDSNGQRLPQLAQTHLSQSQEETSMKSPDSSREKGIFYSFS